MQRPVHGGNLAWAASFARCRVEDILDFSASISPLGPPDSVIQAIQAAMDNIRHYPDPQNRELTQLLSQLHNLPYDWILPGNGSAELLTLVGRDLARFAATVLITPAFGDYYRALRGYEAKVLESSIQLVAHASGNIASGSGLKIPETNISETHIPEVQTVSSELGVQTKMPSTYMCSQLGIFDNRHEKDRDENREFKNLDFGNFELAKGLGLIVNNPHNPTGILFTREAILPLLAKFQMVVVDEAFMDFLPPSQSQSLVEMVGDYPNLVILRSLTKFYSLPGLRIGYAIAQPEILKRWQSWRDPWSVNVLATAAAIAALNDKDFQQATWKWLPPTRQHLYGDLASIPGLKPLPGAANYLLVRTNCPATQLQRELLEQHRILIRDCVSFPELGEGFFRVAVRTQEENRRLVEGLRSLLA